MKEKVKYAVTWAKGIGPNTAQEAREIHRGIYDGMVKYWRPDNFAEALKSFRDRPFKEFEENDKHYYIYLLVSSYLLKYGAIGSAIYVAGLLGL
jgi:hypothetical protein